MYCTNCGCEVTAGNYCSNCGNYVGESTKIVAVAEPLTDVQRLKKAFSSKLFLTMAILSSVGVGMTVLIFGFVGLYFAILPIEYANIIAGALSGVVALSLILPVIELVGFWKTYKNAKGNEPLSSGGPKLIAGVYRVSYVLSWIGCVFMLLMGALSIVGGVLATGDAVGWYVDEVGIALFMFVFIGVMFIVMAIITAVLLIVFERRLLRFMRDVAVSAETGIIDVGNIKTLPTWLLVLGIISAVGGLSGGVTAIVPGAIMICGSFWVKEHFLKNEQNNSEC